MKKMTVLIAAVLALSAPLAALAEMDMDHGSMPMGHGSMDMEHGGHMMGKVAHEEVVDGVKATFSVLDIKAKMKEMGMKETHHIMVVFTDAKSGSKMSEGEVTVKVMGPDKSEQVKALMGMEGGFGSDFTLLEKGKYGVMAKFKLKDGKVRSVKFWYTVK
jgi:FlaG/FlaF family flagellin (archaellin)